MADIGTGTNCFSKSLSALGFFFGGDVCLHDIFPPCNSVFSGSLNLRVFLLLLLVCLFWTGVVCTKCFGTSVLADFFFQNLPHPPSKVKLSTPKLIT